VNRLGQRHHRRTARRRLTPPALDQSPPELAGELVEMSAANALVHLRLSGAGRGLAPGDSLDRMAEIEVRQADVTELEVDAIANAANTGLRHGGGVAAAIARAGGPSVQAESDERAPIGLGEAVETTAGKLPCRWVIHAATMELGGPTSGEIIRRATASTLAKAEGLGVKSLALVAFGTGIGGFPVEEAARIEVEEVRRHLDSGSGLERVVFAVRGEDSERAFTNAIMGGPR
jgi:O-acetyl-ADP-ribose deacetylase